MTAIVTSDADPLSVVANWVVDQSLDPEFRLSAASVCLPYLYPRLSASQVDAKLTVQKVDSADLLRRLDERIAKLGHPATIEAQREPPPLSIEVVPEEDETPG